MSLITSLSTVAVAWAFVAGAYNLAVWMEGKQ